MTNRRPTLRSMLLAGAVALGLTAAASGVAEAAPAGVTTPAGSISTTSIPLGGHLIAPWPSKSCLMHKCTHPVLWP